MPIPKMEPPPPIRALRRVDRRGTAPPCPSCFSFVGVNLRNFFAGDSLEFFADGVGREPGGEEAAIQTGDLLIRDFAARELEFAFDAVANRKPLRLIVGRGFDPRAPLGLKRLLAATEKSAVDVLALELLDESTGQSGRR